MRKNVLIVALALVLALVSCAEPEPLVKSYTVTVKHDGEVTLPDEVSVVPAGEKYTVKTYVIEGYEPSYSDGLEAGDEIEVSSDMVITITWASNQRSFFASGSGTKDDPYVIKNEHQFSNIYHLSESMAASKDNYLYFLVVNDLDFSAANESPMIPVFRGEIDFNGHSVSGVTRTLLNDKASNTQKYIMYKYQGDKKAGGLVQGFISGKISNLTMKYTSQVFIATFGNYLNGGIVEKSDDNAIEFNNVTVSSNNETIALEDDNTNFSGFMSQCFGTKISFIKCTNDTSYEGGKYGSAFLGGYGVNSELLFDECVNHGAITSGKVGFLVGNSNKSGTSSITVRNCRNEALLLGTEDAGYLTWSEAFKTKSVDAASKGQDLVKVLEKVSDVTMSLEDNCFVATSSNTTYDSFKVVGSSYRTFYYGTTNIGTLIYSVSSPVFKSGESSNLAKLQAIDRKAFGSNEHTPFDDGNGNKVVEISNVRYYYNDSTPATEGDAESSYAVIGTESSNYIANLNYTLICYDAEGNIVGSMKITV